MKLCEAEALADEHRNLAKERVRMKEARESLVANRVCPDCSKPLEVQKVERAWWQRLGSLLSTSYPSTMERRHYECSHCQYERVVDFCFDVRGTIAWVVGGGSW